jgi:hypothetical protein
VRIACGVRRPTWGTPPSRPVAHLRTLVSRTKPTKRSAAARLRSLRDPRGAVEDVTLAKVQAGRLLTRIVDAAVGLTVRRRIPRWGAPARHRRTARGRRAPRPRKPPRKPRAYAAFMRPWSPARTSGARYTRGPATAAGAARRARGTGASNPAPC